MKLKDLLTKNLGLKLLSIISAVFIWMVVVNMNDPVSTRRFINVPVRLSNTELITESNRVYRVLDETDSIPVVTVTGQRSIVDSMQSSDIVAAADFNDLTSSGTIAISLSSARYSSRLESIKGSIENVRVEVEEVKSIQRVLQAHTTGTPAEGYVVGDLSMDENLIRISGPRSVVDSISSAGVTVDVSGASGSLTTIADISLFNADGEVIYDTQLTRNVDSVRVRVSILGTKTLNIRASYTGTPAAGYLVMGDAGVSPSTVKVAGDNTSLKSAADIMIPAQDVDITGRTANYSEVFDIRSYLPDGLRLADTEATGEVRVSVAIEEELTKELRLPYSRINLMNVPEDLLAEMYDPRQGETGEIRTVTISVAGPAELVELLTNQNVVGVVDVGVFIEDNGLNTLPAGIYPMPVNIVAEEGIRQTQKVSVSVAVRKAQEEEETETPETQESGSAAETAQQSQTAGEAQQNQTAGAGQQSQTSGTAQQNQTAGENQQSQISQTGQTAEAAP